MPQPKVHTVRVPLPGREYDVIIGRGVSQSLGPRLRALLPRATRCTIAFDPNVPTPMRESFAASLAGSGFTADFFPIVATEQNKQLAAAASLVDHLAARKHERHDPVVALGGGIVGDLAGFGAAIYRRGVPIVQCPTTLLSMVDASVGGKTGANLLIDGSLTKNMVGAFHQPTLVMVELASLDSLPAREFASGLAECIKHAMIGANFQMPDLWEFTEANLAATTSRDDAALGELIARNVSLKAGVVAGDERETAPDSVGGRALLNLGHTFGHVIETLPDLTSRGTRFVPLHGEAVALGLIAATAAASAGFPSQAPTPAKVATAVNNAGLPVNVGGLPNSQRLVELMRHDKKTLTGKIRCIFPMSDASARVVVDPSTEWLVAGWNAIRESPAGMA